MCPVARVRDVSLEYVQTIVQEVSQGAKLRGGAAGGGGNRHVLHAFTVGPSPTGSRGGRVDAPEVGLSDGQTPRPFSLRLLQMLVMCYPMNHNLRLVSSRLLYCRCAIGGGTSARSAQVFASRARAPQLCPEANFESMQWLCPKASSCQNVHQRTSIPTRWRTN